MRAHGIKQSSRSGPVRFGSKTDDYDYSKVIEYTLSPEELLKYQNGEMGGSKMSKFRKEEYQAFKDEGKSDVEIRKIWKIDNNKMNKLKREWGLIGSIGRPSSKMQPEPKEEITQKEPITQISTSPVSHDTNVIELKKVKKQNEDLEKENLRLMKILSEEAKKFVDLEDQLAKKNDQIETLKNKINMLDDAIEAAEISKDSMLNRITKLRQEAQTKDDLLLKQSRSAEADFETACHERDALLTTVKILSRIPS